MHVFQNALSVGYGHRVVVTCNLWVQLLKVKKKKKDQLAYNFWDSVLED